MLANEFPKSDIDFAALIAAARRRTPQERQRAARAKSAVAGSAIVAALVGAQAADGADATEDFAMPGGDLDFLKNATICNGHAAFAASDAPGTAGADHHAQDGVDFSALFSHAPSHATGAATQPHAAHSAQTAEDLCVGSHDGRDASGDGCLPCGLGDNPKDLDGHSHDAGAGAAASGVSAASSGHNHGVSTSTTSLTSPTVTTTTDGHTHSPTPTSPTAPTVPNPIDAAMQKEHIALMNLVPVSAATHVAVNNGSWFDPNTWAGGKVPGDGAKVLIPAGVTVDYDGQSPASIFTIRVDGQLDFATDVDTFMEVDTFVVAPTGTLTIGTEANPVDPNVKAVISFADNGPINVAWDPMLLSRGLISHGTVDIHGAEKETFLKVAVDPMRGDTTITLEAPPTGWQVGDKLVLTGTHLVPEKSGGAGTPVTSVTQDEELIITAINGNVLTVDHALKYDHEGARADLKAYVANYSRNIVFENEGGAATPTHERGHVMLAMSDNIVVKYAEFDELGRTDKSVRSFDVGSLTSVQPDSNIKGRYSLHIHRAGVGDQEHPAILEGNAVYGSPGWGFVQHDSNAILSNNAAYDVFGAAFVAETGNETGRWDHNIAIKSLGVDHITKEAGDVATFDLGRTGTGFWFQGRMVEAVGNVAASIPSGAGFTYFHRGTDPNNLMIDPDSSPLADSLRYLDAVKANEPNIAIFLDNESIATQMGLEIIKANPRQDHDLRSVLENFTAWEVQTGVHLQYTGHYTIKNLDVVASDSKGIGNNFTIGLDLHNNVIDVVVNGANIEGFVTGVRQAKNGVAGLDYMDALDQWDYVYIDVNVHGATRAFTNVTKGDQFLTAADLVDGRLFYNSAFADTHIVMKNGVFNMLGVKTDSIGKTASYEQWDPDYIDTTELRGAIEQNGWWQTADGRRVALIEEYYSDRATGEVIKVGLFVEIPTKYVLQAGGFTRITPAYNGVLDQTSAAPVAAADAANVQQGHSVVIDVLANDSDPDGDAIKLDGLFSQHGHVVENADGTVTYFADPTFSGTDTFYYFVQDTNGDITKGQVTVTVDI